jgi:zinc-binding in reverse transcriptase
MLLIDYNNICSIINNCTLSLELNCVIWRWHISEKFTTHSAYEWLSFREIADIHSTLWSLHVPLKIKIFIWLVQKYKILTRNNLIEKGWIGSTQCYFCVQDESVIHLCLDCPFVQQV